MSELKDLEMFARETAEECITLLLDKSKQYNPDGNFIGTFEFAAKLTKVSPSQAILSRMGDKVLRLSSLLHKRSTATLELSDLDALNDAIEDLINYLILMKWAIK